MNFPPSMVTVRNWFDFRKKLFSMVTRQMGSDDRKPGDAVPHYSKETTYSVDGVFCDHLKICQPCREELVSSLKQTIQLIETGEFWE